MIEVEQEPQGSRMSRTLNHAKLFGKTFDPLVLHAKYLSLSRS